VGYSVLEMLEAFSKACTLALALLCLAFPCLAWPGLALLAAFSKALFSEVLVVTWHGRR